MYPHREVQGESGQGERIHDVPGDTTAATVVAAEGAAVPPGRPSPAGLRLLRQAIDSTEQYRLDLTWTATLTSTLWKYPLIVFEQAAHFSGTLSQRSGEAWTPILQIAEEGFCEYTDRWVGNPAP